MTTIVRTLLTLLLTGATLVAAERLNIVLVLADDLGYGDLPCYGANDIHTPHLSGVDFLPTVCAMTGTQPPSDRPLDGASILPALDGQPIARRTPLYWHFNRASSAVKVAVRIGDWKLLATLDQSPASRGAEITEESERAFKAAEPAAFELYNLRTDLAETTDLAAKEPAKFAELKTALLAKYHEIRDESPTWPAWTGTGSEARKIVWPEDARKPNGGRR